MPLLLSDKEYYQEQFSPPQMTLLHRLSACMCSPHQPTLNTLHTQPICLRKSYIHILHRKCPLICLKKIYIPHCGKYPLTSGDDTPLCEDTPALCGRYPLPSLDNTSHLPVHRRYPYPLWKTPLHPFGKELFSLTHSPAHGRVIFPSPIFGRVISLPPIHGRVTSLTHPFAEECGSLPSTIS